MALRRTLSLRSLFNARCYQPSCSGIIRHGNCCEEKPNYGSFLHQRSFTSSMILSQKLFFFTFVSSAMICCLAMYGLTDECFQLFSEMTTGNNSINPNSVTFVGILGACVHQGLVKEGESYFTMMTEKFGITPSIQHYGCMVDLYGRAGLIEKAESFIASMHMEPDVLIWGSLLSGSRMLGDIKTCEAALKRLIQLDPMNCGAYVLLSNVYAKTGRWIEEAWTYLF